jgi:DNA-binding LytR/AlgR family response regulator
MKRWEQRLPASKFVRVHKSYIINISHVVSIVDSDESGKSASMFYPEMLIPVSRRYGSKLNLAFRP